MSLWRLGPTMRCSWDGREFMIGFDMEEFTGSQRARFGEILSDFRARDVHTV